MEEAHHPPPPASTGSSGKNCYFHAGVEHCEDHDESSSVNCERVERSYNIKLRVGFLFVILATSAMGVYGPILMSTRWSRIHQSVIFVSLRQFGIGVIMSTAFVHLLSHAEIMFRNPCIGHLAYESAASAVALAGTFVSFIIDYTGMRYIEKNSELSMPASTYGSQETTAAPKPHEESRTERLHPRPLSRDGQDLVRDGAEHLRVAILEAGVVFHSLLIGVTLVVAGDSFFITLALVITFHQVFEGMALGSVIATLSCSTMRKAGMAAVFAFITPLGMVIGIAALSRFNGNDKSTLIAIGTLNAFSAGILVWVGVVEMWAHDWLQGHLASADQRKTSCAIVALVMGLAIMSFLGKWA